MSVRPHGTTRFPLDGFLWILVFEYFSKICRENSSFIKVGQEYRVLYMTTDIQFLSHLVHFLLEREMFQTDGEKIKVHILCSIIFFSKIVPYYEIMWKNIIQPGRPQLKIRRMRLACRIYKATITHSEYVILNVYPLQQLLHECAAILCHTCTTCLV